MSTIVDIAEELAACCADAGFNEEPAITDAVVVPAAVVQPGEPFVAYRVAMGGRNTRFARYSFDLALLLNGANKRAAQADLAEHISPGSPLLDALNAVAGASVENVRNMGIVEVGSARYFGAVLMVDVLR